MKLESLLSLGSRAWNQSEVNKQHARLNEWAVAFAAAKTVGKYNGGTAKLAAVCGTSDDTIERLAAAYVIFDRLRLTDAARARKCRKAYGYMRFLTLGVLWRRYESFDDMQAFEYLESELSITAMEQQIIDIHDPRPEWERKGIGFYTGLRKWITDTNIDADIRATAETLVKQLTRLTV